MKVLWRMFRDVVDGIASPIIVLLLAVVLVILSPVFWYVSAKERV